jgi:hypothetical protein
LDIEYSHSDTLHDLRKKLKEHISILRKGKKAEIRSETNRRQKEETRAFYENEFKKIAASWSNSVPQSLKDKVINLFCEQTSSETLATFTCASCAESASLRTHCSLTLNDFDNTLLRRPDLNTNEALFLDRYKWLNPACIHPQMPYDEGLLRDLLVDPDGITMPPDGGVPTLSLCAVCYSSLKNKKMPPLSLANRNFLGLVPDELKDLTVIEAQRETRVGRSVQNCLDNHKR